MFGICKLPEGEGTAVVIEIKLVPLPNGGTRQFGGDRASMSHVPRNPIRERVRHNGVRWSYSFG